MRMRDAPWRRLGLAEPPAVDGGRQVARELDTMDRAVYQAIGSVSTPRLDKAMVRLSNAADKSRLWLGCATIMAALGGGPGRRAALLGVVSVAFSSAGEQPRRETVVGTMPARATRDRHPDATLGTYADVAVHAVRTQRLGVRLRHRGQVCDPRPLGTSARGRHRGRVLASTHRRALPSGRDRGIRARHERGRRRLPDT